MIKGFHNSFEAYCEWCENQAKLGLRTVNWGKWWDEIADKWTPDRDCEQ